jgi:hypothetical protein
MSKQPWGEYQRLQEEASYCQRNEELNVKEDVLTEALNLISKQQTGFDATQFGRQIKNLFPNRRRKWRCRRQALHRHASCFPNLQLSDPAKEAEIKDEVEWIKQHSTPEEFDCLWNVYTLGLRPTAHRMGLPEGTLKSKVCRLKRRLRNAYLRDNSDAGSLDRKRRAPR